jgi:uncharacterized protein YjbI with pentapeptide repeats
MTGQELIEKYERGERDFTHAHLEGANLRGANLVWANISDTISYFGETVSTSPTQLLGLRWDVLIWGSFLKIGCESHTIKEWDSFADEKIAAMDESALKFWRRYKTSIMALCKY